MAVSGGKEYGPGYYDFRNIVEKTFPGKGDEAAERFRFIHFLITTRGQVSGKEFYAAFPNDFKDEEEASDYLISLNYVDGGMRMKGGSTMNDTVKAIQAKTGVQVKEFDWLDEAIDNNKGAIKMIAAFVFSLSALDHAPVVGPIAELATDFAASAPDILGTAAYSAVSTPLSLIPLPGFPLLAIGFGWMFMNMFTLISMCVNFSKMEFKEAARNWMSLFTGKIVSNFLIKLWDGGMKVYGSAGKLYESGQQIIAYIRTMMSNPDVQNRIQTAKTAVKTGVRDAVTTAKDLAATPAVAPQGGEREPPPERVNDEQQPEIVDVEPIMSIDPTIPVELSAEEVETLAHEALENEPLLESLHPVHQAQVQKRIDELIAEFEEEDLTFLPKEGGKFLAQGTDTCVFDPAVSCGSKAVIGIDGTEQKPLKSKKGYVSRITDNADDFKNEQTLFERTKSFPELSKHILLSENLCLRPRLSKTDVSGKEQCSLYPNLTTDGVKRKRYASQMKKYDADFDRQSIRSMPHTTLVAECRSLLSTLVRLNYEFEVFHNDIHRGNVAWHANHLILHDWGRLVVRAAKLRSTIYQMDTHEIAEQPKMAGHAFYKYIEQDETGTNAHLSCWWVVWDSYSFLNVLEHLEVLQRGSAEDFLDTCLDKWNAKSYYPYIQDRFYETETMDTQDAEFQRIGREIAEVVDTFFLTHLTDAWKEGGKRLNRRKTYRRKHNGNARAHTAGSRWGTAWNY